jgi:hypothetical protein
VEVCSRLGRELAPGQPDDDPSGDLKRSVSGAIDLERAASGVERVAVELDDGAVVAPESVDLVPLDVRIHLRPREVVAVEEREEAILEL